MATAEVYIKDALREINVLSEVDPLPAEMGTHGLRRLNQMMSLWTIKDIDIGYFDLAATTDEVAIPDWADLAVTLALAIVLCPKYGKSASAELMGVSQSAIEALSTKVLSDSLKGVNLSYLPQGAGKQGLGSNIETDG